jgi:hypothetical protein
MKLSILGDNNATLSCYEVFEWEVEADWQEEADQQRVVGWNLAAMTEKDLETAEKLWMDLAKVRAHLDAECAEDKVEQ